MEQKYRYLACIEEKVTGQNHLILYSDTQYLGEFDAEYIVPKLRRIYGWWQPSFAATKKYTDNGLPLDTTDHYWSLIEYVPTAESEVIEEELLHKPDATAGDFLKLKWNSWEIHIGAFGQYATDFIWTPTGELLFAAHVDTENKSNENTNGGEKNDKI